MYTRILIPTDGSELAARGVNHGLALAKALGAKAFILTVTEPWSRVGLDELSAETGGLNAVRSIQPLWRSTQERFFPRSSGKRLDGAWRSNSCFCAIIMSLKESWRQSKSTTSIWW